SIPATRLATARPASPTPAPKSTTRSPGRAGVAAATSIASWPARWPDFGWRRRNLPPRKASSVTSLLSSIIRSQLVLQPGITEKLAGLAIIFLVDQDPARQNAKRPLDDAHILV